jgi:two-component system, cell cycle sensor histidine kinase and response regulator CckA
LVKALGGEISVDSVVGEGTTVRVALPAVEAPTEGEALGRSLREPAAPKRRILVIDDERLFASAVRRMLHGEHDVTLVESGREAIGMLADQDFDVVLCDLMMPEVTGMDVFNEVQRSRPGYEERMVFMTGGAFTLAARQFLESVPNVRLDKPFTKDEIRAVVRRLVNDAPQVSGGSKLT